jgi:hypothetical protein
MAYSKAYVSKLNQAQELGKRNIAMVSQSRKERNKQYKPAVLPTLPTTYFG